MDFKNKKWLFLAPLAGYTDLPFRSVVKKFGVDVTTSEMVSSHSLVYAFDKTSKMLEKSPLEDHFMAQISGSKEGVVKEAVEKINALEHVNGIDFNCGCPAPKVANHGNGSGLLKDLDHLVNLLKIIRENTNKKITSVKVRLGFEKKIPKEIAHALNDAPVDYVVVHGRTRSDKYQKDKIDYESIALMKGILKKPVIANGEIDSVKKAFEVLQITQADGLMIGRAALRAPWIFWQIRNNTTKLPAVVKKDLVLEHFDKMVEFYGDRGVIMFRKNLHAYAKGEMQASAFRNCVNTLTEIKSMREGIEEFFNQEMLQSEVPLWVELNQKSV